MADRRMFSKKIIDSDAFLDMPLSTQALYFHLSMRADDEGFVGNPKRIRSMIGASEDDMKLLIVKRFILAFESGVIVIKHWKIHNYIQSDRAVPTTYIEEKKTLALDEKKSYTECIQNVSEMYTPCIQNVSKMDTQDSIGKDSIGKDSIKKEDIEEKKRFCKPTVDEIEAYCRERANGVNAQTFFDFYESKGWRVGNQPMKDWKACVRTWEKREPKKERFGNFNTQDVVNRKLRESYGDDAVNLKN